MTTPFGPQLIGETEKTLNALLRRHLEAPALSEPQWVTLRLADLLDGRLGADGLAAAVADRARFADAADLVRGLTARGLLDGRRLTSAGRELLTTVQAAIDSETAPLWRDLAADDVAATTRVLNELISRARTILV
jgi:hypothetical protein